MRAALLLLILAGCTTTTTAPLSVRLPSRAQVEEAVLGELVCSDTGGSRHCLPLPRRARLSRLRCIPAEDHDHPARVLCRYAGQVEDMRGSRRPLGHECAYFAPMPDGRWRLESFPDHDMCVR